MLVDCQYIEEDEQNYSYILFNDPVCIKATTGFPKEVYKWRYSYKTSKGVTKSGTFEPYDSSDNGATIYVKASDFMSQETFDDLLESQNPITITPDGATGYNKPLSVKGINVTARLTAPKIKSINYTNPLCFGDKADSMVVILNRPLSDNESVTLELEDQNTHIQTHKKYQGNYLVFKNVKPSKYKISILKAEYINAKNQKIPSYSDGAAHSKTITITAPEAVNLSLKQIKHSRCYGDSTGSIEYNVIGGTGSKTCYLVDEATASIIKEQVNIEGSGVFNKLPAGNYQIYATDQNGCHSATIAQSITSPNALLLQVHTTDVTIYGANNGRLEASYSGGTAPYKLEYSNNQFTDVSASTYKLLGENMPACSDTLYLTDSHDCRIAHPFEITQPNPLVAYPRLSEELYCYGDANATITIDSITGGIAPYQVSWYHADNYLSNQNKVSNLSEGTYRLLVTDAAGAVYQQEVTITTPKALTLLAQVSTVSCNGDASGSIDMMVQGGTAPYTYMLDDSIQSHGLFSGLSNMAYYASVEDAHGCKVDSMFTILALDDSQTAPLASFLVAGEAPIHDDVHLINVMDPLQYDSIAWIYPQEDVLLYGKDERSIQLIFLKEGTYSVGMRAYKGTCYNTLYKNVRAVAQNNTIEGTPYAIIEELSISPSPNNGTFTAHIKLGKAENIDLCVYNASSGYVLHRESLMGKSFYTHPLSLSAPAGEYILFITLPAWQKSRWIKFIIY
ncbi:MAG: SprB repeat-containing protein [Paludibacteraceae bacterium]|nr:SprB repeat-containing protein [Paludibacteraceae bacterium]